jgi:glycosyltransferase involved in cell wall biosynthesis
MQIVQITFGVFHHFELAHQLRARNHLRRIYSTFPWARLKREGLPRQFVSCFPYLQTPDFLLGRTSFYPHAISSRMTEWNTSAFELWTRYKIESCDALIALSGAGLTTGPQVQALGGKFICDRGSTHMRYQLELLIEEHRRWNIPFAQPNPEGLRRDELLYNLADAITVPSNIARDSFVKMGVPAKKVHVIPYGVRLDRFKPAESPPTDSFEVLFAGNVSLQKGIPYLLEAFHRLRHPKKHLTVVGGIQNQMRPLLDKLPIEKVTFTGAIPQTELAARMSRSHVMTLASVQEGLALVLGQAMACGCPVVATRATGAEGLFSDGVEGFIINDRDTNALTDRLQRFADDPTLRQQMSAASLERVKYLGGWNTYGDKWDSLLHTLTGCPKDPAELF